jgi:hypothetical protein
VAGPCRNLTTLARPEPLGLLRPLGRANPTVWCGPPAVTQAIGAGNPGDSGMSSS